MSMFEYTITLQVLAPTPSPAEEEWGAGIQKKRSELLEV